MDIYDLLDKIPISNKLIYFIDTQYKKMIGQLRFSLGRLNGMTAVEINRLFNLTDLTQSDLIEYMERFPKNVFVMRQSIYNLLALIIVKAYQVGNDRLALDTNTLLGLVFLGRLKYKYIRMIDQPILEKTVAGLSKKSYIGLHGLVWMVNKVTKDTHDIWMPSILKDLNDPYPMYRYIIDLRNKFNQIMKTIARLYYYNIEHRNDVDRSVVLKNRTNEIVNYIISKNIPDNILQMVVDLCKVNCPETSIDRINNLQYNIQVYNSMQVQISLLINLLLDKIFAYMNIYKAQFDKNLDINDPIFIKSFYTGLKRSTIMLRLASDPVFTTYKYDRYEVLAYAFIITLFVDSQNHNSDYYGNTNLTTNDNFEDQYNYGSYNSSDDDSYDYGFNESILDYYIDDKEESLEAFYEGVMFDNELFELFNMRGDY